MGALGNYGTKVPVFWRLRPHCIFGPMMYE